MAFSSEFLEIQVSAREYSHPIQTATYSPFTKGTLSNVLSACSRWEQPPGILCCRGGGVVGRWLPPSRLRRWGGGVADHPDQCPLAKVCHGEALPWPSL